jgi:quercetin dioxygenase-like cupin family protein
VPSGSVPRMRRWAGIVAVAVGVLSAAACGADTASTASGAAPATSAGSGSTTGSAAPGTTVAVQKDVLATEADPPGGEGSTLTLIRYTIAPGAQLSPHIHPGVQLARIESGTLTYTVIDGTATVTRAGGATEAVTGPTTVSLVTGDSVAENDGMVHFGANETAEPVVIIATLLTADGKDLAVTVTTTTAG